MCFTKSEIDKELIGIFKNNGREWQAKGEETAVNVYDYLSLAVRPQDPPSGSHII